MEAVTMKEYGQVITGLINRENLTKEESKAVSYTHLSISMSLASFSSPLRLPHALRMAS